MTGTGSSPNAVHVGVVLSDLGEATRRRLTRADGPTSGQLEAFCAALSVTTGLDFAPCGTQYYQILLAQLQNGEIDVAWFPPLVALKAMREREAIPIALPVRAGTPFFHSALFARVESKLRGLDDLIAARAAWVDPQSVSGCLLMRASLRARGMDLRRAFGEEWYAGTHDAVVRAVRDGEADVGATYAHFTGDAVRSAGWRRMRVRVLHRAGPIPADLIAASLRLDATVVDMIRGALLSRANAEVSAAARDLFDARSFADVGPAHLAELEALARHLDDTTLEEPTFTSLPPVGPP